MKQKKPRFRELTPDDHGSLMMLWKRCGLTSIKPKGRDSRRALTDQLASGVQIIVGLEMEGLLIGSVLASHDGRKGWINRLAVCPEHRRRGYGALLVGEAERLLKQRGLKVIAALVESDNDGSFGLFQKLGYEEIDPGIHYLSKRDGDDV